VADGESLVRVWSTFEGEPKLKSGALAAFVKESERSREIGSPQLSEMIHWRERMCMPAGQADELPMLHARVLAHLMSGATYATTARSLHLSERTVRRLVKEMMDDVGAANHVQLGAAVERLGWLRRGVAGPARGDHPRPT
jgi:DNA-binding NarL/FixJ family response regulator